MNIYQRIAAVQKDCSHVAKDTEVGFGNNKYKAVSHDGVLTMLRQSIMDNGIVVAVSQQCKGESIPSGVTKNGTGIIRFEAVYEISFINVEDPAERLTVAVEAHGEDTNDKAPGKAISYATKTAMLKTFMIVTGENDESRTEKSLPAIDYERELRSCPTLSVLKSVYEDMPQAEKTRLKSVKDGMKLKLEGKP